MPVKQNRAASRPPAAGKAPKVTIYIDGSCVGNPGPGGWGVLLISGERNRELSGGEAQTTNNRMELTAAIKALEALKRPVAVEVYCDSAYLVKGITLWLPGWKRRNWRGAGGKSVLNRDLWEQLDALAGRHRIQWKWIQGHSGDPGNEHAHKLASQGAHQKGNNAAS